MSTYILRRLVLLVPTLFGISLLVFALMRLLPGDVVQMMIGAEITLSPEQRTALYKLVGLDAPTHIQFLRWMGNVLRGDLGTSLRTAQPVTTILMQRLSGVGWMILNGIHQRDYPVVLDGDPQRSHALLPRTRHAAARSVVGHDAQLGP